MPNHDYDELLAASVDSDFQPPSEIPKSTLGPAHVVNPESEEAPADSNEGSEDVAAASGSDDAWKDQYESYLHNWREEHSIARQKAQETRAEWEQRRADEKAANAPREDEWEKVREKRRAESMSESQLAAAGVNTGSSSPCYADARDLTSGEGEKGAGLRDLNAMLPNIDQPVHSYPDTLNAEKDSPSDKEKAALDSLAASHQWTNLHSNDSSYPDIDFPSQMPSQPSSQPDSSPRHLPDESSKDAAGRVPLSYTQPDSQDHPHPHSHTRARGKEEEDRPPSATLTIFDTALPMRTRLLALSSALAINFLLPFVNGVMLGFGEIFAKDIVQRLGWGRGRAARTAATAIGVGAVSSKRRETQQ